MLEGLVVDDEPRHRFSCGWSGRTGTGWAADAGAVGPAAGAGGRSPGRSPVGGGDGEGVRAVLRGPADEDEEPGGLELVHGPLQARDGVQHFSVGVVQGQADAARGAGDPEVLDDLGDVSVGAAHGVGLDRAQRLGGAQ